MSTFSKLIILDHEPFSERKRSHYFIDSFIHEGIVLEYWCLANVLSYSKDIIYSYGLQDDCVVTFEHFSDLLSELQKLDACQTALIVECWFDITTVKIFKIIKEKGLVWVKIDYYCNPTNYLNPITSIYKRFFKQRKKIFSKILNYLKIRLYKKQLLDQPDILFLTGSNRANISVAKKTVSLHYFDIEEYKDKIRKPRILDFKYIVFLDIMLVDHPDSQRIGYEEVIPRTLYFSLLNQFFSALEEKTGLPVVIASHPKANYTDEFGHRLCIKNKTAELSIASEMVVTHGSLSISYALLAEKPLVYVYFEKLFKANEELKLVMYRMYKACRMLGTPMVNMETSNFDFKIPVPSKELYKNFLDLLYRSPISAQPKNFEVLLGELNNMFHKGDNAL